MPFGATGMRVDVAPGLGYGTGAGGPAAGPSDKNRTLGALDSWLYLTHSQERHVFEELDLKIGDKRKPTARPETIHSACMGCPTQVCSGLK